MTMPPSERYNQHLTDAELNELFDGTLPASEGAAARSHLASCAECEERYRTLQATISALQHAPSLLPRRSFQLTPEQAKLPAKQTSWLDRFAQRAVPGLPAIRAATLAVALLLISVAAIDVITNRDGTSDQAPVTQMRQPVETAPAAGEADRAAEPAQVEATNAPLPDGEAGEAVSSDSASGGAAVNASESVSPQGALGPNAPAAAPAPASIPSEATSAEAPALFAEAAPASPVASPTAAATPAPADSQDSGNGGLSISRWRIAELSLLLLLLWLIVSWVGRSRVDDRPAPPLS